MQIVLIDTDKIYSISLPSTISGKYWIEDSQARGDVRRILSVEADTERNAWVVKNGKLVKGFKDNDQFVDRIWVKPGNIYQIYLGYEETHEAYLMAEEEDISFHRFQKYRVSGNILLTVGRGKNQNIQWNNPMVSGEHLTLSYQNGSWAVLDAPGQNGTYLNSNKIEGAAALAPGDVISVLFYKIIIGYDFIALNDPNHTVNIATDAIVPIHTQKNTDTSPVMLENHKFFYRSPRFVENVPSDQLRVDMPTNPDRQDNTPVLLTIAPAMLMGLASVSTGIISIINTLENNGSIVKALPTILMSVSMLGGMIVFPMIMKKRERKKATEREQERQDKYLSYLQNIRGEIGRIKKVQEKRRNEDQPNILIYAERENFWQRNLWERTPDHADFLGIRLGSGNIPMDLDISFPEERFTIEEDVMREELLKLQREERILVDVPVSVSLRENKVFGIVGETKDVYNVLNNLLLQVFLLHGYDEVKIIFLHEKADAGAFSYARRAQHIWDDKGKKRFLAVTENNLRELNIEMGRLVNKRLEISGSDQDVLPHYIIVSASKNMTNRCSFISEILENSNIQGVSLVCAYDEIRNLPKECRAYATVGGNRGILFTDGLQTGFLQDVVSSVQAERLVGKMSNCMLDLQQGRYDLPEMMTFLEMFRVSNYRHLNVIQRWKENDPVKSLRTPIGVDTNGEIFYLDLHEKFHGPHGLVAGMTGSGKSEFLITYILSMAVNYHPDEVAFVLIDYKGGGLAGAFDNEQYRLPHLAGTITNLDGSAVMRSILSIKSELRKRQIVFNQARAVANEGTMDIYKYQKLYRDGKVSEPVPHLFIIADEFAELKDQQPEFLEQLISTARIGRSLGVHLILATQKPSGVVSEQIWANSKFKVCLKVQDRADSMDMLKRPDAAELVETGRFFLQVGYNELFELGQSSWCGAPYVEASGDGEDFDEPIEMIDELGNVIEKIKGRAGTEGVKKGKQIIHVMEHLGEISAMLNLHERQLWQPELPAIILEDALKEKYAQDKRAELSVIVGEVDDPYSQRRFALEINFNRMGNLLLYGATGSGKEMLLTTLIYALYSEYDARDVNTYILDFGSEFLKNFENAPQCSGVVMDGQDERISALFTHLQKEIKIRKKILSGFGGSIVDYRASGCSMPFVVVIVNNYAQFAENYEQYEEKLTVLTREGQKYGVYFVMTATGSSSVRFRVSQNFTNTLVLQLNDKSDYITILGNTNGIYPPAIKGRGIMKAGNGETYVFQTARVTENELDNRDLIQNLCEFLRQNAGTEMSYKLRVAPKFLSGQELQGQGWSLARLPIGINCQSCDVEELNLLQKGVQWILSENAEEGFLFAGGIIEALNGVEDLKIYVLDPNSKGEYDNNAVINVNQDLEERIIEVFEMSLERNNEYKTSGSIQKSEILVVLHGYSQIRDAVGEDCKDKLRVLLEKAEDFWRVAFLVFDAYKETNKYSLEEWVRSKIKGNGIWIGAGVENQIRFNIHNKSRPNLGSADERTGFLLENGNMKIFRPVLPMKERRDDDEE